MLHGKVGVSPGTTTLTFNGVQQDPGVIVRNAYGVPTPSMGGLGRVNHFSARPTDFELSKIYGYTPVHRGWLVGQVNGVGEIPMDRHDWLSLAGAAVVGGASAFALHGQGRAASAIGGGLGAALGAFLAGLLAEKL